MFFYFGSSIKKIFTSLCIVVLLVAHIAPMSAEETSQQSSLATFQDFKPIKQDKKSAFRSEIENGLDDYVIEFKDNQAKAKGTEKIKRLRGTIKKEFKHFNVVHAVLNEESLTALKQEKEVVRIESNHIVRAQGEDVPWGIKHINAPAVHTQGMQGEGVKIAVFDTGISDHPDLTISGGASFVDGSYGYMDDNGHGTHVAGTIASLSNDTGLVGVAPAAQLYAVKVLDTYGEGTYSTVIAGIEWAIENEMNIINMSFGGLYDSKILEKVLQQAYQQNMLLVASAGNSGDEQHSEITYPANYRDVIAVGAVDPSDERVAFSGIGPNLELVAPGVNIESTSNIGRYKTKSGTSMAAAHVTGVAALVWGKDLTVSHEIIRGLLHHSALGLGDHAHYGHGLVDAKYAVEMYAGYVGSALDPKKDKSKNKRKKWKKGKKKNGMTADTVTTDGTVESYIVESSHPYSNNYANTWTISKSGAANIRVHFSYIDTESGFDLVRTNAGDSWSGSYATGVWSNWSGSSSLLVTLTSDGSVTKNGFKIDQIEYIPATSGSASEAYNLQSPHPYPNSYNQTWTVSKAGATNIRLHFSSIQTESSYDYVRTNAGDSWSGTYTDVWSNWSGSSSITVTLTSDGSVTKDGFYIDKIEYATGTTPSVTAITSNIEEIVDYHAFTKQLVVQAAYSNGATQDVTMQAIYTTSDPGVVSVIAPGQIKSVGLGSATVTISYNGKTTEVTFDVLQPAVTDLFFHSVPFNPTIQAGQVYNFTVYADFTDGGTRYMSDVATYHIANPAILIRATKEPHPSDHYLVGINSGSTKAYATYGGFATDEASVTVTESVGSLRVDDDNLSLQIGESHPIDLEADGVNVKYANYQSSDNTVATVNSDGVITARGKGTTTITARFAGDEITIAVSGYGQPFNGASYTPLDLYVSTNGIISNVGKYARRYDGQGVFVNITPSNDILARIAGSGFFAENGSFWIPTSALSSYTPVQTESSKVTIYWNDGDSTATPSTLSDAETIQPDRTITVGWVFYTYEASITSVPYDSRPYVRYELYPSFVFGWIKPYRIDLTNRIKASYTTRTGSYTTKSEVGCINNVTDLFARCVTKVPMDKTAFWGAEFYVRSYDTSGSDSESHNTEIELRNKKGVTYPKWIDPQSRLVLWEPPANLAVNYVKRSSNYRSTFMTYYNQTYGYPIYYTWNQVDIHHMRPLQYGGSNDISNLLPLFKGVKQYPYNPDNILRHEVVNAWWKNY